MINKVEEKLSNNNPRTGNMEKCPYCRTGKRK